MKVVIISSSHSGCVVTFKQRFSTGGLLLASLVWWLSTPSCCGQFMHCWTTESCLPQGNEQIKLTAVYIIFVCFLSQSVPQYLVLVHCVDSGCIFLCEGQRAGVVKSGEACSAPTVPRFYSVLVHFLLPPSSSHVVYTVKVPYYLWQIKSLTIISHLFHLQALTQFFFYLSILFSTYFYFVMYHRLKSKILIKHAYLSMQFIICVLFFFFFSLSRLPVDIYCPSIDMTTVCPLSPNLLFCLWSVSVPVPPSTLGGEMSGLCCVLHWLISHI